MTSSLIDWCQLTSFTKFTINYVESGGQVDVISRLVNAYGYPSTYHYADAGINARA